MTTVSSTSYPLTPAIRRRFARRLRVGAHFMGTRCITFGASRDSRAGRSVTTNHGRAVFYAYGRRWPATHVAILIARADSHPNETFGLDDLTGVPVGSLCGNPLCVRAEHLLVGGYSPRRPIWTNKQ